MNVERDLGLFDDGLEGDLGEIVPVERDIELPHRWHDAFEGVDELGEAFGDRHAPRVDTDQGQVIRPLVPLDDLVGDAV